MLDLLLKYSFLQPSVLLYIYRSRENDRNSGEYDVCTVIPGMKETTGKYRRRKGSTEI